VFSCGKIFENWVVEILKKQKSIKIKTQVRAENKDLDLSGYADLILSNKKEGIVYELKSKNSKSFWYMADKGEGAMKQHQLQLFSYLYMLGFKEGKIVYIEKDTLSILEYPVLLSNRELEKEFLDELNLLNTAWKLKDPKILPLPKKDNWKGRYCQYHKQCVNL
jgi:CRISPR/Cas system-associated exonuclease Cas4 (RecB family)